VIELGPANFVESEKNTLQDSHWVFQHKKTRGGRGKTVEIGGNSWIKKTFFRAHKFGSKRPFPKIFGAFG